MNWKVEDTANRSVGLMVKCEQVKLVMNVRRISLRILSMVLVLSGKEMTVIAVYGPQNGRSEEDKHKRIKTALYWGISMSMLKAR